MSGKKLKKKSLVGWTKRNWEQDFYRHSITGRIMHAEIHNGYCEYKIYNNYDPVKVRITIEEIGDKK